MILNFAHKKVLVVVAHPDDELLGLGGAMNRLIHVEKCMVHVVILGEGITSRSNSRDTKIWEKQLATHRTNIKSAQSAIGFQSVSIYDFPDNRFDTVALLDIIKVVEKEKLNFEPDIIFTHHSGDVNIDHQITFQAVITACRPMESECVKSIITFETPSGTEWIPSSDPRKFSPNLFIAISRDNLEAKIVGMESYEFEKRKYPHPRSPEALRIRAEMWGISCGVNLAEAFQIIRTSF